MEDERRERVLAEADQEDAHELTVHLVRAMNEFFEEDPSRLAIKDVLIGLVSFVVHVLHHCATSGDLSPTMRQLLCRSFLDTLELQLGKRFGVPFGVDDMGAVGRKDLQ